MRRGRVRTHASEVIRDMVEPEVGTRGTTPLSALANCGNLKERCAIGDYPASDRFEMAGQGLASKAEVSLAASMFIGKQLTDPSRQKVRSKRFLKELYPFGEHAVMDCGLLCVA
jgi:hypothetical protein